jgi:hypothetical protein
MSSNENENPAYLNSSKNFNPTKTEDYGAFFYSERLGNVAKTNWYDKFISYGASREVLQKNLCEQNVQKCIETRNIKTSNMKITVFIIYLFKRSWSKIVA